MSQRHTGEQLLGTEGAQFSSTNQFGSIRRPLTQFMGTHSLQGAAARFSGAQVRRAQPQTVGHLTWTHTEDLVEVSADAHLLVELRGLGQVGAGFEVRHGEDVGSSLTGSCKWRSTRKGFYFEKNKNQRVHYFLKKKKLNNSVP